MAQAEMNEAVRHQLAIEYNCRADDFNKDGIIFTSAEKTEGEENYHFLKKM